jgi:protein SCO1/2
VRSEFALLIAAMLLAGCPQPVRELHSGHGIVRDVLADEGQVVVAHQAIPDLMGAMTMNFDVPDPALLARLERGQVIDFALRVRGRRYEIIGVSVVDTVPIDGSEPLSVLAPPEEMAAGFDLVDQDGGRLRLSDLAGRAVLLDFVFTHCPGPCPILTGIHVSLQRQLPAALRERTHFVSISLDPERDTPAALRAYAEARGADLSGWSFLTGEKPEIEAVLSAYGVGRVLTAGEEIQHTLVTYLIDPSGRIAKRYLGLSHEPEAMLEDLRELLSRG